MQGGGVITFRYRRYKLLMYQGFQPNGQQIANIIQIINATIKQTKETRLFVDLLKIQLISKWKPNRQ